MTNILNKPEETEKNVNVNLNISVYVVIANEEEKVKECFVFSDFDKADEMFKKLKSIYGGVNVALYNRKINDKSFLPFATQQENKS